MKIYFVRHGETETNVKKVYNSLEEDINETGIKQVTLLKEEIKNIDFDAIYASPLLRTKHTAEILNVNNMEIIYDERLIEREVGDLIGKPYGTIDRELLWKYDGVIPDETVESVKDIFKRVYGFIEELKEKDYKNVLIVSHGGVSRIFSAYFEGIPKNGKLLIYGMKNAELKIFEF